MMRVRAGEVSQPLMSRSMKLVLAAHPVPVPPVNRSYDLVIENLSFRLLTAQEPCARRLLSPSAVHTLDILAGPFPPREVSHVPMFNEGVVLTPRFIDKMLTHDVAAQQGECAAIRRPTKLARYFSE